MTTSPNNTAAPDRFIRKSMIASLVLLALGAVMFLTWVAMPQIVPQFIFVLGIISLIAALSLWAAILIDRLIRSILGKPRRSYSLFSPRGFECPDCGYDLRGIRGLYSPECGTVRPRPFDGEDEMN